MEPRIDVITLAVSDLERALEFYRALGLDSPLAAQLLREHQLARWHAARRLVFPVPRGRGLESSSFRPAEGARTRPRALREKDRQTRMVEPNLRRRATCVDCCGFLPRLRSSSEAIRGMRER
jgi:Glyoxalase/Bleomycin resistance protein/Dioxygenase superfamily